MKRTTFHVTVEPREQVLVHHRGALEAVHGPGRHRCNPGREFVVVDTGERLTTLAPQEVATADQLTVRVTMALRWRVADPVAWHESTGQPDDMLYLAAQVALRDEVAQFEAAEAPGRLRGDEVAVRLRTAVTATVTRLGIEVLAVVVKDVMLATEIRAALTQAVVAKHQGAAKLEAARAETAALRSLANAAKLLDDHPALARLRMVEAAHYGSKLVFTEQAAS